MKEATGELNMTVITVVAVVAVGALFTIFVLPRLRNSVGNSTNCASASCDRAECAQNKTCTCTYVDETGQPKDITCKNPYLEENQNNN